MSAAKHAELLIVDDDPEFRSTLVRRFLRRGYQVCEASDGSEALGLAERRQFDVAILDMVMPKMSGAELVRHVREKRPEVSILVISGYTGDSLDGAWLGENNAAFLSKPFTSQQLARRVRELLNSGCVSRDGSRDGAEGPARRDRD